MSKVYYLQHISACEFEGTTEFPLLASTNKRQLDYISTRLNNISGCNDDYFVKLAFDYLPKGCNNLVFIAEEDCDFNWHSFEVLSCFLDVKKAINLIEKDFMKHTKENAKKYTSGTSRVTKYIVPIQQDITRSQIENLLHQANSSYKECEKELKSMQDGSFWMKKQ